MPEQGPPPFKPSLTAREEVEAGKRSSPSARVVHEAIRLEGEDELARPWRALAWSALAAGLSMGFTLVAEGLLRSFLPDAPWRSLVSKLGYPVGFLVVILGRQQLFTENTLTAVLPLLSRRDRATLAKVARLWIVVLICNLLGAALFAWAAAVSPAFTPEVKRAFGEIGREAVSLGFGAALLRGILAGWLIALVVWLLPAAETGRIAVIFVLTYLIGLGQFPHIVAGSVEALFAVASGRFSTGGYLAGYLSPTLLGNIIGGVSLVSALNHAQVIAGKRREPVEGGDQN